MKCKVCGGAGTSNTCVNGTFKPCSFCDGTGEVMTDDVKIRCDDCKFVEDCVDYGWDGCRKFTPKPSEPMTNEEWIKSLDTELLAKVLKEITDKCATCDTNQYDQRGECPFERCRIGLNEFVEWLKEKHE